ncbi:M20/M25/M40 family metallo-hydrolase [Vibrio pectenicida]|uniref:M20/M25/M40 family metallo-hydrolase n=1 Tax=Vibrio pectenicida TaxID=62763 RepID=A0A7Y4A0A5_9VIBR|nr:M20/M25/M40 family metallo-hydrolase [Vibrio pectenicida]
MKKTLITLALFGHMSAFAASDSTELKEGEVWITTDADAKHLITQHGADILTSFSHKGFAAYPNTLVAKIHQNQLASLSSHMHQEKHRCGGYMVHEDQENALRAAAMPLSVSLFEKPEISHHETVESLIAQVEPNNILTTIENLTSFTNRFYTTSTGIAASDWLFERWSEEIKEVSFASARQISHSEYPQQSVEVTLLGSKYPEEIVAVGGHLDSTVGSWTTEGTISPGADDDASGIATATEALRLMIASGIQPDRTIKFYAYAAEEVGLRGSQDIAETLKDQQANVISVLQLDMTNHQGSAHDVTFMTDYTDANLVEFLTELMDTYISELTYDTDRCGYACSDHASWHNAGYSAAIPAESFFHDTNPNLHTPNDTLENSDPTASHATKFAKLAVAYLVETSLDDINSPVKELEGGVPVEGLSSGYFDEQFFTFTTTEVGEVTISISGPQGGDADLYVTYDGPVSKTEFDCRPFQNGSNEQCIFNKPAGTFKIMLRGYRNFNDVSIVASFNQEIPSD